MRRPNFAVATGLWLLVAIVPAASARASPPANATALEARLYAPCCYGGTLDAHDSELARNLRGEIEARIARGEAPEAIQADFVARFGEKVVASKTDFPMKAMGLGVLGLMSMVGAGAAWRMGRTRRSATQASPPELAVGNGDDSLASLESRLDAELEDLDG
ncbi:MAG: cytochrome c-type biogenesis protein CcmH [Polyangiaceae bacterium]